MKTLLRALLLVAAFALACGDTTTTHFCSYDSDCPEEGPAFCVNGVCQAAECQEARDCDDGLVCVDGDCTDG